VTTVTSGKAISSLIGGLRARGRMIVVGAAMDPIEVCRCNCCLARGIEGSLTGSPLDSEETLEFGGGRADAGPQIGAALRLGGPMNGRFENSV
jgi:alcohol dehydrogenase, propanol-preferring